MRLRCQIDPKSDDLERFNEFIDFDDPWFLVKEMGSRE
jgi:hypothetical protein